MSKTQIALPPNSLQAYRDAYTGLFNPEIQGRGHMESHILGLRAVLALPREPATCGETGDLIRRLRNWPAVEDKSADSLSSVTVGDLLNEAAAALELITSSMEIDPKGIDDLREEVHYWKSDLDARISSLTVALRSAQDAGETALTIALRGQLQSSVAAYDEAKAGQWREPCAFCDKPIRPGQMQVHDGENGSSAHAECAGLPGGGILTADEDIDAELAKRVEAAKALLAEPDPTDPVDEREEDLKKRAAALGFRLTFKRATAPGTLQGRYALAKYLATGQETTFTESPDTSLLDKIENWLKVDLPQAEGMPFGGQSL